jgi:predicted acylesterase/phospholipase RssA
MGSNGVRRPCDLVMKGGITSGVVYPGAVRVLAERYEFRNIGGASAGAIAAAITAAAELGARSGRGGYPELDRVMEELRVPGFLRGLFQPSPATRAVFELALRLTEGSALGRVGLLLVRGAVAGWWLVVPALAMAVLLEVVVASSVRGPWLVPALVIGALLSVVSLAAASGAGLVVGAGRFRRGLEENGFGMCSGVSQPGSRGPALSDWLHQRIQACAGRTPRDPPLTFRDLADAEPHPIDLRLVTTDLSHGRPVILPAEPGSYLFRREDLERVVPEGVVRWMWERAEVPEWLDHATDRDPASFRSLPSEDLPVVLAARLSLSFPVLISAVRLWSYDAMGGGLLETWFSDGGISSNFPIHFFDSFLPGHPTFALDLAPGAAAPGVPEVSMPSRPAEQRAPRWQGVTGIVGFFRQIADVMQNWRDSMQAEVPGFRDRICQIRLGPGEGGLNVNMGRAAIDSLIRKGAAAGETIVETFDEPHWQNHRFTRYLTSMQRLQVELQRMGGRFEDFGPFLAEGAAGVDEFRMCHDEAWCAVAARETGDLLSVSGRWGPEGGVDFFRDQGCRADPEACPHCEPEPRPALRIVPNV